MALPIRIPYGPGLLRAITFLLILRSLPMRFLLPHPFGDPTQVLFLTDLKRKNYPRKRPQSRFAAGKFAKPKTKNHRLGQHQNLWGNFNNESVSSPIFQKQRNFSWTITTPAKGIAKKNRLQSTRQNGKNCFQKNPPNA